jgi:hypothetical protein
MVSTDTFEGMEQPIRHPSPVPALHELVFDVIGNAPREDMCFLDAYDSEAAGFQEFTGFSG